MKKYFINLDCRKDRLESMLSNEYSKSFTRVKAIHFGEIHDDYICGNGYKITSAENACFLSHLKVWELVTKDHSILMDDFVLIAEDDVTFKKNIDDVLNCINESEYRFIQCINEANQDSILVGKVPVELNRTTTACYLIRKSLCAELYDKFANNNIVFIADMFSDYLNERLGLLHGSFVYHNELSNVSDITPHTNKVLKERLQNVGIRLDNWLI